MGSTNYLYKGEEYTPEECEARADIEYFSNGTWTMTEFYEILGEEECIPYTSNANWEYLGNNFYRFTEEDDESYIGEITFSSNNSIFTIESEDEDGSYRAVYKRI